MGDCGVRIGFWAGSWGSEAGDGKEVSMGTERTGKQAGRAREVGRGWQRRTPVSGSLNTACLPSSQPSGRPYALPVQVSPLP